jgi:hypothetical protein
MPYVKTGRKRGRPKKPADLLHAAHAAMDGLIRDNPGMSVREADRRVCIKFKVPVGSLRKSFSKRRRESQREQRRSSSTRSPVGIAAFLDHNWLVELSPAKQIATLFDDAPPRALYFTEQLRELGRIWRKIH